MICGPTDVQPFARLWNGTNKRILGMTMAAAIEQECVTVVVNQKAIRTTAMVGRFVFRIRRKQKPWGLARCKTCVEKNRVDLFDPYSTNSTHNYPKAYNLADELYNAVSDLNITGAQQLLEAGADPNYAHQLSVFVPSIQSRYKHVYVWSDKGDPVPTPDYDARVGWYQPTRPLTLAVWKISCYAASAWDFDLGRFAWSEEEYQDRLESIAQLLLAAGADIVPAKRMMGEATDWNEKSWWK